MPIIASRASAAYGAGFGKVLGSAFEPVGAFDAISTVVVPSGNLSSVTFAGIPQTGYSHLQLRLFTQTNRTIYGRSGFNITFNSDTGNNYSYHYILAFEEGSSATASNSVSQPQIRLDGAGTSVSDSWGILVIDIFDYSNATKNKTIKALTGLSLNALTSGAGGEAGIQSGAWYNTSPINSIGIAPGSGESSILQYSHLALYGVK